MKKILITKIFVLFSIVASIAQPNLQIENIDIRYYSNGSQIVPDSIFFTVHNTGNEANSNFVLNMRVSVDDVFSSNDPFFWVAQHHGELLPDQSALWYAKVQDLNINNPNYSGYSYIFFITRDIVNNVVWVSEGIKLIDRP